MIDPREPPSSEEHQGTSASGQGAVAIGGNVERTVIVTGDNNNVTLTENDGRVLQGSYTLKSYWRSVECLAEYPLRPPVFTASRDEEIAAIQKWLADPPNSLFLKTHGLNEGLDFLAAVAESQCQERLQGAIIVSTSEAWNQLATSREPQTLIADPALELSASSVSGAVAAGHHVFVSGPRAVVGNRSSKALRRQDYLSISTALQECGFPESRARTLGQACCGSSSILKRLITRHPETRFPDWCRDEVRPELAPLSLIGGWVHIDPQDGDTVSQFGAPRPLDVWVITELLGYSPEDLDRIVARWQSAAEPLFLRFGATVLVASREDAWHLFGGSLTQEQLRKFRKLALLVLDEDNPALQLEPEKRWLANLYGKVPSLSEELRGSIIETLLLMTTYPTAEADHGLDFKGTVGWILEQALPRRATWQRWASFGKNLKYVAEAAPDFFLSRVEEDLKSDDPELPKLFQDKSNSIFVGAIHSDLLWALEGLAWSPQYLSRVAVALAQLAARDSGGTYANRPMKSLCEIFLPWLWHTNASAEERLRALSQIIVAVPEVGWKLLTNLLPGNRSFYSDGTHQPRWRAWAEGWSRERIRPQSKEFQLELANLTLATAGSNPQRWADVSEGLLRILPETTERALATLEAIAEARTADDGAVFPLWTKLRKIVARHERHPSAPWAFPADVRKRLASIRDRLAPSDPVFRNHFLFDGDPVDLPDTDPAISFQAYETALRQARLSALRQIVTSYGIDGVFRLLEISKSSYDTGWLVGEDQLVSIEDIGIPESLDGEDNKRLSFVNAYLLCRHRREGWVFTNRIPTTGWSARQVATFARCLPFDEETWRWLQPFGEEIEREYWSHVRCHRRQTDVGQVHTVCQSLIKVGRPFAAVDVLHSAVHDQLSVSSVLIVEVLEATISTTSVEGETAFHEVVHDLQQLVKVLQEDTSVDHERLANIEWGLLAALDRDTSDVQPSTLMRAALTSPEFFVRLLTIMFRGENEHSEASASEHEQLRARNANDLVERLFSLPGTDDQGVVDFAYLRSWTIDVRTRAANNHRLSMCDYTLGELIARASMSADGIWPAPNVASFMEEIGTESLFEGFETAVIHGRSATSQSPWEGGNQERALAARYRELSERARPASSQLAEAFLRLAVHYDNYADQEDERAERRKLGR